MKDQINSAERDIQRETGVDDLARGEIDSASAAVGAMAINAVRPSAIPGEQESVPDERIERLARAAARGATGPEADIRYEYRKRALLRVQARLKNDRKLVLARKQAS